MNGTRTATGTSSRIQLGCSTGGSLRIIHANENDIRGRKHITFLSNKDKYSNLRRDFPILKTNIVLYVEAAGCSCWEIYDHPGFVGTKQDIDPGDRTYLKRKPVSVRPVKCEEYDDESYDSGYYGYD